MLNGTENQGFRQVVAALHDVPRDAGDSEVGAAGMGNLCLRLFFGVACWLKPWSAPMYPLRAGIVIGAGEWRPGCVARYRHIIAERSITDLYMPKKQHRASAARFSKRLKQGA